MKSNRAYIITVHQQDWRGYISYYIMEHNGKAMIRVTQTGDEFELSDLYVEEKYRGQGLGEYMLDYAIGFSKRLTKHGILTISTNTHSADFCDEWYQRLGFKFDRMESPISLEDDDQELEWGTVYKIEF